MRQGVRDHLRLLVDLLGHEVAVVSFVHNEAGRERSCYRTHDARARAVANGYTLPCYHGPISILEIGDLVRKRCKCDSVRADKHFAVAVANGKRTALARHNHQIVMPAEDHGEREGASQLRQGKCGGGNWVVACVQLARDQMRDNLGVRFARELRAFG